MVAETALEGWTVVRVAAMNRLALARAEHRDLLHAEAHARVDLAAAIMAMDEAEDQPGRHNLVEQQAVNTALIAYGDALADLIRGEKGAPDSPAEAPGVEAAIAGSNA